MGGNHQTGLQVSETCGRNQLGADFRQRARAHTYLNEAGANPCGWDSIPELAYPSRCNILDRLRICEARNILAPYRTSEARVRNDLQATGLRQSSQKARVPA